MPSEQIRFGGLSLAGLFVGVAIGDMTDTPAFVTYTAYVMAAVCLFWSLLWIAAGTSSWLAGRAPDRIPPAIPKSMAKSGWWPYRRLVPLRQAAHMARRVNSGTQLAKMIEATDVRDLETYATLVLQDGGLRLFGFPERFDSFEEVPEERLRDWRVSEDARDLYNQFNEKHRYVGCAVLRHELAARLVHIKRHP